ncbi:MAG TPA: PBP1A family penicillin-binding protein [Vicinamibacterales bacterium]|nr:PBP1A family penicillin-binding protein [Vicinamibacterales bacterium]
MNTISAVNIREALQRLRTFGLWRLTAILFATAGTVLMADVVIGTPSPAVLKSRVRGPQLTTVYDVNNKPVFTIFKERRIEVPLTEVSKHLVQAVLAIEDQRFYRHEGLDVWRIGGALVANVRQGERAQGGSTITQQLARKSFLTDDKTFRRKFKEMFLAMRIERHFTKDQILELYLNRVYFGDGLYGVEAASMGYFGKPAKAVNVEEAALLAGLIKAPSAYSPTTHLDRAVARRTIVLRQMVDAGFLEKTVATSLEAAPVRLQNGFPPDSKGQYFKNHITRILVERFGWERLSRDGLRVYATVDPAMQQAAEVQVAAGLSRAEKLPGFTRSHPPLRRDAKSPLVVGKPAYLQGALVAIDPSNGEVRAMVGGREFDDSQFNRAIQAERQAGSAFKPFVYAAAMESGYTPATLLTNLDDPMMASGGAWVPEDGHSSSTSMTVRTALRTSSNRAAVQVLKAVGIPRAVSYAARLGLEAPSVPSLVLGSGDVTLLSITSAYGAFANGGWLREPVFIRRVEDADGKLLFTQPPSARQAISEQTAFQMAQMLADVVNSGTGYRTREAGFTAPAAGKTGTTNDYRDAWFIGFTPQLVAGVWVGFDKPQTILPGGYAGELAAPIWGRFMKDATGNRNAGWLKQPSGIVGVEICRMTGALPVEGCRRVRTTDKDGYEVEKSFVGMEYFRVGTEPVDSCTAHAEVSINDRLRRFLGLIGR